MCIDQAWPNVLLSAVLLRGVQLGKMKQIEVLAMVSGTRQPHVRHVQQRSRRHAPVHRLDPESDNVQKPHEPPSGYSRAGVKTGEYSSVDYGGKALFEAKEKGAKSAKGSGGAA